MRVIVPHTAVHPDTLAGVPEDAEWYDVSDSPVAYWELLCSVWADGETFCVIEHDVVCRPDVIEEFEECPEPWCVFPYDDFCHRECQEAWRNMLGCTRFDASLIAAVPQALEDIEERRRPWLNLCDGIGNNLRAAGFTHHWHEPAVHHHHMRLDHLTALIGG